MSSWGTPGISEGIIANSLTGLDLPVILEDLVAVSLQHSSLINPWRSLRGMDNQAKHLLTFTTPIKLGSIGLRSTCSRTRRLFDPSRHLLVTPVTCSLLQLRFLTLIVLLMQ